MERRQVEYFLAVVEHGGFTSAAHALRVAQPSLSHAIRGLERELGGALFHRLPHGVVLTAAGEALVGPARRVLRDLATADSAVREVLGLGGGTLDIVAQTTLAVDPLAALVGRFRAAYPRVQVRVTDPENVPDVVARVRSGESELGLVDAGTPLSGLSTVDLGEQELFAVLPPSADVTGPLALAELAALDLVTTPHGTVTRQILDDAMELAPRVVVETAHRAMIVPLVLAGAGAALLPRSMAEDAAHRGAVVVALRPRLLRRSCLLWRPGPLSPAAARFVELVS